MRVLCVCVTEQSRLRREADLGSLQFPRQRPSPPWAVSRALGRCWLGAPLATGGWRFESGSLVKLQPQIPSLGQADQLTWALAWLRSVSGSTEPNQTNVTNTDDLNLLGACALSWIRLSCPLRTESKTRSHRLDQLSLFLQWRTRRSSPRGTTPRRSTSRSRRPSSSQR